jgi:hypothetical protein
MTAKELITELETILQARGGRDIEVLMEVDLQVYYDIAMITSVDDRDVVILSSLESCIEAEKYVGGLHCTPAEAKLN